MKFQIKCLIFSCHFSPEKRHLKGGALTSHGSNPHENLRDSDITEQRKGLRSIRVIFGLIFKIIRIMSYVTKELSSLKSENNF